MVFDAFIIGWEMIPHDIKIKFGHPAVTVFVFTDESHLSMSYKSSTLTINGKTYSYLFMQGIRSGELQGVNVAHVRVKEHEWKTMSAIYKKEFSASIDKDRVLESAEGLPFRSEEDAINFFVDEVVFSPEGGMMAMGLCLLDKFNREMTRSIKIKRLNKMPGTP